MQKNVDKAFFLPYNTYKQTQYIREENLMYCIIKGNRVMKRFDSLEKAHAYAVSHAAAIKKLENIRIIRAIQKIIALVLLALALVSPKILYGEGSFLVIMVPVSAYFFFTKDLWLLEIFGKGE